MVVSGATLSIIQEKMSHENKRQFCFLLQPSYDVEFTDIKSTSSNKDYIDPVDVAIEKDGSKSTITIKATVKKEIPQDTIVSTPTRGISATLNTPTTDISAVLSTPTR
jgi:hypothetical protein